MKVKIKNPRGGVSVAVEGPWYTIPRVLWAARWLLRTTEKTAPVAMDCVREKAVRQPGVTVREFNGRDV